MQLIFKILAWILAIISILSALIYSAFLVLIVIVEINNGNSKSVEDEYGVFLIVTFIIAPIGYGLSRLFFYLADREF